jgi:hypothetical protein
MGWVNVFAMDGTILPSQTTNNKAKVPLKPLPERQKSPALRRPDL